MHSPDCSIERAPRAQFVIVSANRFGRGDDVEFTESRAKANARSAALKRRGVTHRIMHEWRYPASHLFGDVWRPVLLPAGDRTLQKAGLVSEPPERPSERAMRMADQSGFKP